jgi:NitT/TauT family transport system permease protein
MSVDPVDNVRGRLNADWAYAVLSLLSLLAAWQVAAMYLDNPLLMPTVFATVDATIELINNGVLVDHATDTLIRALIGFSAAAVVGIVVGILMGTRGWAEFLFDPVISFGYPIPKIAFYPIVLIVFGFGHLPKIILVFLECTIPVVLGAYYGVRGVDRDYVWAARNMGASNWQIFSEIRLPASLPYIFSGLRTALPIALIVAIVTEMISSQSGLGYGIIRYSSSLQFDAMFGMFIAIAFIGYVFDLIMRITRARLLFWAEDADNSI